MSGYQGYRGGPHRDIFMRHARAQSRKSGQRSLGGEQGNGGGRQVLVPDKRRHQEKALIVTMSACMLLILSRILQAHGGKPQRRGLGSARKELLAPSSPPGRGGRGQKGRRWRQVMDIAGRRFLVTGGASLIGSHLTEQLLEAGAAAVILFDNYALGSPEVAASLAQDPRGAARP